MTTLSRWAKKVVPLFVCGLVALTVFGSYDDGVQSASQDSIQPATQAAAASHTLQCLLKGPSPSLLEDQDPIDIAMAWGVEATIDSDSAKSIAAFTWVLEQAPKTDSRYIYAWYNLRCVQLSLAPIVQLDLEADQPRIELVAYPIPRATSSATDQSQPQLSMPTGYAYDYSQLLRTAPGYLATNHGLVEIAIHLDPTTILRVTQEWRRIAATNSDAADVLRNNAEAINGLDTLGALVKLACNVSKALISNCEPLTVQAAETVPYETDQTRDSSMVDSSDLVDFTVVIKLFTGKNDNRDKEVKVFIEDLHMGSIPIAPKPDQTMELALPPLPSYSYLAKAVYVDSQQECGCGTKTSGSEEIQENDVLLVTTVSAKKENGYKPRTAYTGERLRVVFPDDAVK